VPISFVTLVPNDNPALYPPSKLGFAINAKSAVDKNGFNRTFDPPSEGGGGGGGGAND